MTKHLCYVLNPNMQHYDPLLFHHLVEKYHVMEEELDGELRHLLVNYRMKGPISEEGKEELEKYEGGQIELDKIENKEQKELGLPEEETPNSFVWAEKYTEDGFLLKPDLHPHHRTTLDCYFEILEPEKTKYDNPLLRTVEKNLNLE